MAITPQLLPTSLLTNAVLVVRDPNNPQPPNGTGDPIVPLSPASAAIAARALAIMVTKDAASFATLDTDSLNKLIEQRRPAMEALAQAILEFIVDNAEVISTGVVTVSTAPGAVFITPTGLPIVPIVPVVPIGEIL